MTKVLTFGVFDLLHLGHLRLFQNCKKHGDYLIVAVQDGDYVLKFKPEAKVVYSTAERIEMVEALRPVDEVITYQAVDIPTLEAIDFDLLVLGGDQTADRFQNAEKWCLSHGKQVVHLARTPGICSSELKRERHLKQS